MAIGRKPFLRTVKYQICCSPPLHASVEACAPKAPAPLLSSPGRRRLHSHPNSPLRSGATVLLGPPLLHGMVELGLRLHAERGGGGGDAEEHGEGEIERPEAVREEHDLEDADLHPPSPPHTAEWGRTAGVIELHRHHLPTRRSREQRRPFPSALHPLTL
ncbi:hypothetical protein PAHAL_8G138800 [Panicum hallii]|uniref:Uncharacterized protein n=1 Tax=Panicum hallii TaxID=206008 RepID=A0A2T8I8T8_9POAL|nr:hypothetical protein PAHAL_8G138800 [Panicum hallii]